MTTVWVSKGGTTSNQKVYHTRKEHALERILEHNLVEFDSDQLEILGYRACATCVDKIVMSHVDIAVAEAIRKVTYRRPEEYDLPLDKVDDFVTALAYRGFEIKAIPRARREEMEDQGFVIERLIDAGVGNLTPEEAQKTAALTPFDLPTDPPPVVNGGARYGGSRHGRLGPLADSRGFHPHPDGP